eukprot:426563_1
MSTPSKKIRMHYGNELLHGCNGNIIKCNCTNRIISILQKYNALGDNDQDTKQFLDECLHYITETLNEFHHLLFYHDSNDSDFEYMHKLVGVCEINSCVSIKRNKRNRFEMQNNYDKMHKMYYVKNNCDYNMNVEYIALQQVIDCIHCHYCHTYDVGYRLTRNEQIEISKNINTNFEIKKSRINNVLFRSNIPSNKFRTDLGKMMLKNESEKKQDCAVGVKQYSYGIRLYYWKYYKNLNKDDSVFNYDLRKFQDIYVPPKYTNFKQELIDNHISTIGINQWNNELKKVTMHSGTNYCKSINGFVSKYVQCYKNTPWHLATYGYDDESILNEYHLLSIMVYCAYNVLQYKFSSTFRYKNDNENLQSLMKRHSNFHFLSKYLRETVEIFGKCSRLSPSIAVYHGINEHMLFECTHSVIFGPLSTTLSWHVAMNFSNNSGMILELCPDINLKYLDCFWLSPFPGESELLFVGGFFPLQFVNITDVTNGYQYKKFILSLNIID